MDRSMEEPMHQAAFDSAIPIAATVFGVALNSIALVAEATTQSLPSFDSISNIGTVGVVSLLVWYLTTRGIPSLAEDARKEREVMQANFFALLREEAEANRAAIATMQARMHEDSAMVAASLNRLCDQVSK